MKRVVLFALLLVAPALLRAQEVVVFKDHRALVVTGHRVQGDWTYLRIGSGEMAVQSSTILLISDQEKVARPAPPPPERPQPARTPTYQPTVVRAPGLAREPMRPAVEPHLGLPPPPEYAPPSQEEDEEEGDDASAADDEDAEDDQKPVAPPKVEPRQFPQVPPSPAGNWPQNVVPPGVKPDNR